MSSPPALPPPGRTSSALWLRSPALNPPLRIGLLLNDTKLPRFCARIVEDILASNFATLELLVCHKTPLALASAPSKSLARRITRRLFNSNLRKHSLYELYLRMDQRKRPASHPLDLIDCSGMLAGIDRINVEPVKQKFIHRFTEDTLQEIRARNLDVLIRFGFNILRGEILSAARYGVWSFHHGDNEFYRGGPPHFWELYEGAALSGVVLQVLTEELDAGTVLCKSLFTTQQTFSVSLNRFGPYWGASDMIIRKLNELHRFGWNHLLEHSIPPAPYQGRRKLYRTPTNVEMARWLAPVLIRKAVARPFQKKTVQRWKIGIRQNATPLFDAASDGSLRGFRWIEPVRGHFWADPFLLDWQDKKWIFFEDYVYARNRGHIACAELTPDGNLIDPVPCIEHSAHHYSYPYVFQDGNQLLMIPEASDSYSVDLYRCEEFPFKWKLQTTLLQGKFVDTSVWRHDGLWWMMTSTADPDSRSMSLYLFYSESLAGPWRMHPSNPISTDARNNRGAGRIIAAGGRLIRPSQSCCPIYGYSFSLNEVTRLSPTEYEERTVREFKPDALKVAAVHTYNWISGVEVIDGAKPARLATV